MKITIDNRQLDFNNPNDVIFARQALITILQNYDELGRLKEKTTYTLGI